MALIFDLTLLAAVDYASTNLAVWSDLSGGVVVLNLFFSLG